MALFHNTNYDFIKWRWHAIALSSLIIAGGLFYAFRNGVPLGIDFSGGTIVVVQFEKPVSDDQVRQAVSSVAAENVIQTFGDPVPTPSPPQTTSRSRIGSMIIENQTRPPIVPGGTICVHVGGPASVIAQTPPG